MGPRRMPAAAAAGSATALASDGAASRTGRHLVRGAVVLVVYLALAAVLTHPLGVKIADHTLIHPRDSLLNAWILSWDYHAVGSHPHRLFDTNVFYPAKRTLALSEHMLGNLPLFAVPFALTGNPILAANTVAVASFALSGTAMFALVYYWTRRALPAFVAGFVYAFAPPRMGQLNHLQLLGMQWFPLVLLFGHRFLASGSLRAGFAACAFYILQVLTSYYLGYMCTVLLACFGAYYAAVLGAFRDPRMVAKTCLLLLVAAAVILPLSYPYILQREVGLLAPDRAFLISTSADLAVSFLSLPVYGDNVYHRLLGHFQAAEYSWEKWLFAGFLPFVLMAIAIGGARSRWRRRADSPRDCRPRWDHHTVGSHVLLVLVAFVLALGPVLVWRGSVTGIALPYSWLSDAIPGFSSMRVPARFGLAMLPGLAVLAGLGTDVLLRRVRGWLRAAPRTRRAGAGLAGLAVVAGLALEFHVAPLPMDPIETGPSVPPVYRWLATQARDAVVLEVPFEVAGDPARSLLLAPRYMYFSTYHWRTLVNGYSGYEPPSYNRMRERTRDLPDPESLQYLRALGVHYIIVHFDLLSAAETERWRAVPLERVAEFGPDVVYALRAASSPGSAPLPPLGPSPHHVR